MKSKLVNPSWFNVFIPLSVASHYVVPIEILFQSSLRFLGIVLIVAGVALNQVASATLRSSQTPVDFRLTPAKLVVSGPFRFTRNPIYLGGLIVLIGVALSLGSLISFFFPVLLFLFLQFLYIPVEEKEMERIFGNQFSDYRRKVRRWV
jgi:protein-S-isoprenylcysteine O-methyltransferase Ste14